MNAHGITLPFSLQPWLRTLDRSENKVQIHHLRTKRCHMVKRLRMSSIWSRDIRINAPVFLPCRARRSQMSCQLWSYWTKVHEIFTRYGSIIYAVNAHIEVAISHSVSECQCDERGEFAIFQQNWLPWQRPLRYWKKRSRLIICNKKLAFIRWKDCKTRSSGSWDNW